MDNQTKSLAIIGGGASGLAAAIAAGERARELGIPLSITIYERDDRVGRSILVTGNGRCNFSNERIFTARYYNSEFVADAFMALHARSFWWEDREGYDSGACEWLVVSFFESCGLLWRQEADGRRYPLANKASVVVDVLRAAAARVGAREACGTAVKSVELPRSQGKRFTLRMADGVLQRADAVIVACGGRALNELDVEGVQALRQRPVLGPLRVADKDIPFVRELDNIRVRCSVHLDRDRGDYYSPVAVEQGELMFRKYGVSGICVFDLSRFAWPGDVLYVDLLQLDGTDNAERYMLARRNELVRRFGKGLTCSDMLRGLVLPRIADALLKRLKLSENQVCDEDTARLLGNELSGITLEVAGIGDVDNCQVRRGGYLVEQFDPSTMAALQAPGLFATGEALDVDGPCGGYNLHWAWTSGLIAGCAAVEGLS